MFRPTDRLRLFALLHVSLDIHKHFTKIKFKFEVLNQRMFFFSDSCAVFPSFLSLFGRSVFTVIWQKYHIMKDSALRTSYLAVT